MGPGPGAFVLFWLCPLLLCLEERTGDPLAFEGFVVFFLAASLFTTSPGDSLPGMNAFSPAQVKGMEKAVWGGVGVSLNRIPAHCLMDHLEEQCFTKGALPSSGSGP